MISPPRLHFTAIALSGALLSLVPVTDLPAADGAEAVRDSYQSVLDGLRERSQRVNTGFHSLVRLNSIVQITEGIDGSGNAALLTLEIIKGDRLAQERLRRYDLSEQESKLRRREILTRDGREFHRWYDHNEGFVYTSGGVDGALAGARPVKMISRFFMDHQNRPFPVSMELHEYLDPRFRFPETVTDAERLEIADTLAAIDDPQERRREAERLNRMELTALEDGRFQIAIHPFTRPTVDPIYYVEYTTHSDGAIDRYRQVPYADPDQLRHDVTVHDYTEIDGLRIPSRWTEKGCLTPDADGNCVYQYEYENKLLSAGFHEADALPNDLFTLRDDFPETARIHGEDFDAGITFDGTEFVDNSSFDPFGFDQMPSLFDQFYEGGLEKALREFDFKDYYEKQRAAIAWHIHRGEWE